MIEIVLILVFLILLILFYLIYKKIGEQKRTNKEIEHLTQMLSREQELNSSLNNKLDKITIILEEKNKQLTDFKLINLNIDDKFNRLNPITNFLQQFNNSKKSGVLGEVILENILTANGFLNNTTNEIGTFTTRKNIEGQNPDFILHITKDNYIVIDSKSLEIDFNNSDKLTLKKSILRQMNELAEKQYNYLEKSLDFIIMFVPFDEVIDIIEIEHFNKNVILATPSTIQPILYLLKSLIKEQKYTNFNHISKELKVIYESLVSATNSFYSAKKNLQGLLKDFDMIEKNISNIEDIYKTFETFKALSDINTKKSLNKNIG